MPGTYKIQEESTESKKTFAHSMMLMPIHKHHAYTYKIIITISIILKNKQKIIKDSKYNNEYSQEKRNKGIRKLRKRDTSIKAINKQTNNYIKPLSEHFIVYIFCSFLLVLFKFLIYQVLNFKSYTSQTSSLQLLHIIC